MAQTKPRREGEHPISGEASPAVSPPGLANAAVDGGSDVGASSTTRLGTYLRRLREGYGYTLRKVEERAMAMGEAIDNSQLSRFEKGKAVPSFEKLRALARVFNVPVQNFSDVLDLEEYQHLKPRSAEYGELLKTGAEWLARGEHGRAFVTYERALRGGAGAGRCGELRGTRGVGRGSSLADGHRVEGAGQAVHDRARAARDSQESQSASRLDASPHAAPVELSLPRAGRFVPGLRAGQGMPGAGATRRAIRSPKPVCSTRWETSSTTRGSPRRPSITTAPRWRSSESWAGTKKWKPPYSPIWAAAS